MTVHPYGGELTKTYTSDSFTRPNQHRDDARGGVTDEREHDFSFIAGCWSDERQALAAERMLHEADLGFPCKARPPSGILVTQRPYRTGAVGHGFAGAEYCVYVLVWVRH